MNTAGKKGKSGQQIALENHRRFQGWIAERDQANDWQDYWRGDKLSRTDIAAECGLGRSALRQNPAIKAELEALEARLRSQAAFALGDEKTRQNGVLMGVDDNSNEALTRRLMQSKSSAEKRIKALEEENAALKAQVSMLRQESRKYAHIDKHLEATGRMLHP